MKKLLKSVICGIREQCTGALFTVDKSTIAGGTNKQKKKKKKNAVQKRKRQNHLNPNGYQIVFSQVHKFFLHFGEIVIW